MPIDLDPRAKSLGITGFLRIKCGDFHFKLKLNPKHLVADFPTFGMLLRAKRMGAEFTKLIADIPALPKFPASSGQPTSFLSDQFVFAAVKSRPIGRLSLKNGKLKFRPTPFRFFRKLK